MDYESIAKKILQRVGGKENVISLGIFQTKYRKKHHRIRKNRMYFLC